MNKNDNEINISHYAVAFIDLLGQKEAMKALDYIPETDSDIKHYIKTLKKTAGVVEDLNRSTHDFLKMASQVNHDSRLPKHLRDFVNKMKDWEVKHQRLSDGLVVFSSLQDNNKLCPVVGVGRLLLLCSSLMMLSLAKNHPIRGGIDVGVCMELYPNEPYGPGVAKAYQLESSIAQYPRIVIGNTLLDYLHKEANKHTTSTAESFNSKIAKICLGYFAEDADGHIILNYLGQGVKDIFHGSFDHTEILGRINNFVGSQGLKFKKEKNTKLITRYMLLDNYISSQLPLWL